MFQKMQHIPRETLILEIRRPSFAQDVPCQIAAFKNHVFSKLQHITRETLTFDVFNQKCFRIFYHPPTPPSHGKTQTSSALKALPVIDSHIGHCTSCGIVGCVSWPRLS
jgi:hypothetical protein